MKSLIIFPVFFLAITGCRTSGKLGAMSQPKETGHLKYEPPADGSNKIAFFTFNVSQKDTAGDKYEFALLKTVFAAGTLKKYAPDSKQIYERNYFYCKLEYSDVKENETIKIEDPLNRIYEYPSEDAALAKAVIKQASGRFTLRFQYHKDIEFLSILKTTKSQPDTLNVIYHAAF